MAQGKLFERDKNGIRFTPGTMNLVKAPDALRPGEYTYLQNVRGYLEDRLVSRTPQSAALYTVPASPVVSVRRLNDSTPAGPAQGYSVISAGGIPATGGPRLNVNSASVATGLTGNPVAMVPFRPNTSVQPWMYVADISPAPNVTISAFPTFHCSGMLKVRSDGLTYKWGIAEPQQAPIVSTSATTITGSATLNATAIPWTNVGGANSSYNYGHSSAGDGTAPLLITGLSPGSVMTITVGGTATINGGAKTPLSTQTNTSSFPGWYIYPGSTASSSVITGAFTDGSGNVIAGTLSAPNPVDISSNATITVPTGASQLQIGINSSGNTFSANSGTMTVAWSIKISSIATQVSTLGTVTAYYWGDSPHSGPVASYIWKNPNDSTSAGIVRSTGNAAGNTVGNSWQFDSSPEDGTVPVQWDSLNSSGAVQGTIPLFSPALESAGYQDFNAAIVGNLFIPAAGSYTFTFVNKDQIMVGIGGGATVSGPPTGQFGQTMTVVSGLPLVYVSVPNGTGAAVTQNVVINFPASGTYAIEIDWDYWEHTGRIMKMTVNGATIPPVQAATHTNASYIYIFRSSVTGAISNPSPASSVQSTPVLGNTVTPAYSPDPQVDKVDYYRQDSGLPNYTYVATGPNTFPPTSITDVLTDLAVANNPILQFDNFEPFPSIDLPRSGTVNVVGSIVTWVSGDQFNTRWLPGTVISIGLPTGAASPLPPQVSYTLPSRPLSSTSMIIPGIQSGNGYVYNIDEPLLAAQPLASVWGPTDNTAYMFGCYDTLRPGTLYFTKGNNPDSAPDTNQIEVTNPSDPLMNGCIINGLSMVFSTEYAWLCFPTFLQALATQTGIEGSQFSLTKSITNRGLFIRTCLCVEGGHTAFFRGKDGIYASPGGAGSVSLTDETLYNIFPHEGANPLSTGSPQPAPVFVGGSIVYPPDDTRPNAQQLSFANGYLYYDYEDANGIRRTLVYDVKAKGWSVDTYTAVATVHSLEEGQNINDVLMGCIDGTIRTFDPTATDLQQSVVSTPVLNNGDARAFKTLGDIFVRAQVEATKPISVGIFTNQFLNQLFVFSPTQLNGTGILQPTIIDSNNDGLQVIDLSAQFIWNISRVNYLDLWQPNFTSLPENIIGRSTDWDDLGTAGNKFIQGGLIEADSANIPKSFSIQRGDDLAEFVPNESPMTFNGQSIQPFTFTPPFLAHTVRKISDDNVQWRSGPDDGWRYQLIWKPYPEATQYWSTEGITHGLKGFQHVFQVNLAYSAPSQPVTLTVLADGKPVSVQFPITTSGLYPTKLLLKLPPCKGKVFTYTLASTAPFYVWEAETEVWVHEWSETVEYRIITPFGGRSSQGAEV